MAPCPGRRDLAAQVAGSVILLDALAARLLLRADAVHVYFRNRPIPAACAFHRSTGLPCPTCGLTRAIVLALHGDMRGAWSMAPVGPVLVIGLLALAGVLLVTAGKGRGNRWLAATRTQSWLRRSGLLYAAATLAIWLGGWMAQFWTAWHAR